MSLWKNLCLPGAYLDNPRSLLKDRVHPPAALTALQVVDEEQGWRRLLKELWQNVGTDQNLQRMYRWCVLVLARIL